MSGAGDAAEDTVEDRGEADARLRAGYGWLPYRLLGGAALAGCAVVLLCDVVMWFLVEGYDPLGQTISELAAGPHHWVQDGGILVFVLGVAALTVGMALRGTSDALSWAVRAGFVLLAIDVALIALWNEYGDGEPGGVEIHLYCVGALYVLVGFLLWFGPSVPPARGERTARLAKGVAIAWVVAAPLFYVVPDGVDGAYERMLAAVMVGAVAIAAHQLYRRPKEG